MSPETVGTATETWSLIEDLIVAAKAQFMTLAREFELAPPQLLALRALDPGDPLPMSELAGGMHLDNSTVTGIVDRLEERGLVERRTAPHDRRVRMLVLTEAGVALRERLVARWAEVPTPLTKLSTSDQAALRDILRRALAG
jgi:DNA-binding MarR family transcriptional regulator